MPDARDHGVGAALGGKLYVIGGRSGSLSAHVTRVDVYDPVARTWSLARPMPTSRAGMAAAVVRDRIVVAGGEGHTNDSGVFDATEAYDPRTDTWTTLPPMRSPKHGTGAGSVDGTFLVPGGAPVRAFGAVATVEALVGL